MTTKPSLHIDVCITAGLMYPGQWSETHQIRLQRDCHLVQPIILQHSRKMALNLNAGVIAGTVSTTVSFSKVVLSQGPVNKVFLGVFLI